MNQPETKVIVPLGAGSWRGMVTMLRGEPSHSRILGGSLVMLIGSGLVSSVNFCYNVAVARLLGPAGFGHAAAAVTLLMLVSAITLAFQLVCAKLVARSQSDGEKAAVYTMLLRRAWIVGLALGGVLGLASHAVSGYLRLPSNNVVLLLGAGVAFYIPLGVKRGGYQGVYAFSRLTANFIIEALVKFSAAIVLMKMGFGVNGAVGAIAASVVLAYFLPLTPPELKAQPAAGIPLSFSEGMQAIVFFVGQVIINNIDILLVKHFFAPSQAGLYAAIALVGRVVYMLGWSVVSAMFPISAGAKRDSSSATVLVVPLLFVLGIALAFTVGLGLFPEVALRAVFGPGFRAARVGLDSLLMLYAAATGAYALSVVLMAYEMSRKLANSGWVQLAFSGMILIGISVFHATLYQVVVVQLVLMVGLLIASAIPFFRMPVAIVEEAVETTGVTAATCTGRLRRLHQVTEAEVIAAFLRAEYHHSEYQPDRERFVEVAFSSDFSNEAENALRRALLFRRRGTMWRELPADTEWFEVELGVNDIENLRVFPRAQWRKLASGSFVLKQILERIREGRFTGRTGQFIETIRQFSELLQRRLDRSSILLIGIDEAQPLTIIEGNHRVTAAALADPQLVQQFRFYCGFSPRMTECCWYQTNLATLYRYARNRLKLVLYDREAEIANLMRLHHDAKRTAAGSDVARNRSGSTVALPRESNSPAETRQAS